MAPVEDGNPLRAAALLLAFIVFLTLAAHVCVELEGDTTTEGVRK